MGDTDDVFQFPCAFPIKVMGKKSDDFSSMVVGIIKKHIHDTNDITIDSRLSTGDKYVSITATINAQSRKQLDAIYQELKDNEQVVMLL
jgi:uncharacterized protein